jgi:hypothetical protein
VASFVKDGDFGVSATRLGLASSFLEAGLCGLLRDHDHESITMSRNLCRSRFALTIPVNILFLLNEEGQHISYHLVKGGENEVGNTAIPAAIQGGKDHDGHKHDER